MQKLCSEGIAPCQYAVFIYNPQALHLVRLNLVRQYQAAYTTLLQEWSEACHHLSKAVTLDDKDAGIRSALAQARKGKDAAKQKERAAYAKMFG